MTRGGWPRKRLDNCHDSSEQFEMKTPKHARRQAKSLFRSCFVNGVLDPDKTRQAVDQVLEVKPRGYIPMLTHFQRLIKLELQRRSARVESVEPLTSSLQSAIQSRLEQRYGPGLNLTFVQSPDLLGGVRIRVGSDVFDGSVRGRLDNLKDAFDSV
jgi:F-type H+-transporting ATPase subunit delta